MTKKQNVISGIKDLERLVSAIQQTNQFFLNQIQRQVNTSFTLRNWLVGYYIVEYEQNGADRAEYGKKLLQNLADRLKNAGSMSTIFAFSLR